MISLGLALGFSLGFELVLGLALDFAFGLLGTRFCTWLFARLRADTWL